AAPDRADRVGGYLAGRLREAAKRAPAIKAVRGKGLLLALDLDRPAGGVVGGCREQGLLVLTAGDTILRLTPPLVLEEPDVDRGVEVIERGLSRSASGDTSCPAPTPRRATSQTCSRSPPRGRSASGPAATPRRWPVGRWPWSSKSPPSAPASPSRSAWPSWAAPRSTWPPRTSASAAGSRWPTWAGTWAAGSTGS